LFQNDVNYGFTYSVKDDYSGSNFGHTESRHKDNTEGEYFVHLPDGRVQTVKYNVDPYSGYVAEVFYEGEAYSPAPQPAYHPTPKNKQPAYALPPKPSYSLAPKPSFSLATKPYYSLAPKPLYHPQQKPKVYQHPIETKVYQHPQETKVEPVAPSHVLPSTVRPYHAAAPYASPYQPVSAPSYQQPAHYLPAPPSYHTSPYHRPFYPQHVYAPPPSPPRFYKNSIRDQEKKKKVLKEDIYLKTENELAGKDFSEPFFYHYKKKHGKGNLGKPKQSHSP
jgi:hypothetical protein